MCSRWAAEAIGGDLAVGHPHRANGLISMSSLASQCAGDDNAQRDGSSGPAQSRVVGRRRRTLRRIPPGSAAEATRCRRCLWDAVRTLKAPTAPGCRAAYLIAAELLHFPKRTNG